MHNVTLVDDDKEIRELLSGYLEKNGFNVSGFESAEALLAAGIDGAELVILDIGLPGMDGLELCRLLRKDYDVPIIMLTAASDDIDRILGLELGADDYMGKPFNPRELLARLKALLRRSLKQPAPANKTSDLVLELTARRASFKGNELELTGAEFELLQILYDHPGEVISRDQLSISLKGHPAPPFDRSIDTQVSRLRAKLSKVCDSDPIKSIRGKGYLLVIQ